MNLNLTPEKMADAFAEWFRDSGHEGKLTKAEVTRLAEAFSAGMLFGVALGIEACVP